jgi:hypothetical protein
MKRAIVAFLLTAALATPALAGGFRQGGATTPSPAFAYNLTKSGKSYRAHDYVPGFAAMAQYRGAPEHRQAGPHAHSSNR